jgi:hypothetical protein
VVSYQYLPRWKGVVRGQEGGRRVEPGYQGWYIQEGTIEPTCVGCSRWQNTLLLLPGRARHTGTATHPPSSWGSSRQYTTVGGGQQGESSR